MKTYESLGDEELLLMHRSGDSTAYSILTERFFGMRFFAAHKIAPIPASQLDDWSINEAHFHAYLAATEGYEFRKVRFRTYYMHLLRHELNSLAMAERLRGVSMDQLIDADNDEGTYTLCDVVPSGAMRDDPNAFLVYSESLAALSALPKGMDKNTVCLVRFLAMGYPLPVAAKNVGLSHSKARYELRHFRKWARETLARVFDKPDLLEEKQRGIDTLIRWEENGGEEKGQGMPALVKGDD